MIGSVTRDMPRVKLSDAAPGRAPCPACGQPLFGWLQIDTAAGPRALERCEECGLGIDAQRRREAEAELAELAGVDRPADEVRLRFANRASLQASLGGSRWAALQPPRRFYLTPEAAHRLLSRQGRSAGAARPVRGRSLAAMWRTATGTLTFADDRGLRHAVNLLIRVLAALPVVVLTTPLELVAWALRRGGVVELTAGPAAGGGAQPRP